MKTYQLHSLAGRKKWQLAVGIVLVYLPIRIYVSNVQIDWAMVQTKAPLWTIEFLVNVAFFRVWIIIVEKIGFFFEWIDGRITVQLPARLFAFLFGVGIAIMFNFAFIGIWIGMTSFFKTQFDVIITRTQFERNPYTRAQRTKANTGLTVMAMLATFYIVSNRKNFLKVQQLLLDAEQLEKENLKAQLLVLKNQVNPHFLFNNFSILTSLIESDPKKSIIFLNRLSQSYRYILSQPDSEKISLKAELEFIETYIFLLKSRFEEKLQVAIDIPRTHCERFQIAPSTLQLLIENAVKHNRMSDEDPLIISIFVENDYLIVSNPIQLRPVTENSTGLGLSNIVNRYKLLTDKEISIVSNGYFTIKIPLLS
ncbi:histidine kinase [Dyadobacter sp. 32]|uniref:sensor histidine kinase n=1 Tax=Dyadobacter sp. 32 TaxID=538966 RepID=UPI0011EDADC4